MVSSLLIKDLIFVKSKFTFVFFLTFLVPCLHLSKLVLINEFTKLYFPSIFLIC